MWSFKRTECEWSDAFHLPLRLHYGQASPQIRPAGWQFFVRLTGKPIGWAFRTRWGRWVMFIERDDRTIKCLGDRERLDEAGRHMLERYRDAA